MAEARDLSGSELEVGLTASFEREITASDVIAFASLSGDENPLHLDAAYAGDTNYGRPIVHGAFQVSLASAMAGMHLPGKRVVLGSVRSRFPAPLYYPCGVSVRGEIVSWFAEAHSGMLRVRVQERVSSTLTAEVHMGFSLHEPSTALKVEPPLAPLGAGRELVVVTGANGAVGQAVMLRLGQAFDVLGLVRRPLSHQTGAGPRAKDAIVCDLESDDWEARASSVLGERSVYAVVHTAWPGAPKGGLLELELDVIRRQLDFGGPTTIRLARWLLRHSREQARVVLVGSTSGTLHPELSLAGYSLGKATLEHTLRLLAPELAQRGVTINGILPSYMPIGINQAKTERATRLEEARVPVGRLCSVEDVCAAVEYFLSPAASFVTGQLLPLTGGRL